MHKAQQPTFSDSYWKKSIKRIYYFKMPSINYYWPRVCKVSSCAEWVKLTVHYRCHSILDIRYNFCCYSSVKASRLRKGFLSWLPCTTHSLYVLGETNFPAHVMQSSRISHAE